MSSKRMKRWLIEAALFVAMLLIFWIFLRYITSEHIAAGDGAAVPASLTPQRA